MKRTRGSRPLLAAADRVGPGVGACFSRDQDETDRVRLAAQITSQIAKAVLRPAGQQAEEVEFSRAAKELITGQALPIQTRAERPRSTATPDRPSATTADAGLRNFAGGHEEVTAPRPRLAPAEAADGFALMSPLRGCPGRRFRMVAEVRRWG
ncbi:hypothetical protein ABIA32_004523 [Streptacidiphilus sp. MAP12-20]|uniref:hypothetical protein n=1 Tax=Streptacidiphilus sp. MAP12-20 TaxID=3156299 RepID=UPI003512F1B4